jgi:hypothetical protein
MNILPTEIINLIILNLTDYEKLIFLSCSMIMNSWKNIIKYTYPDNICVMNKICEDFVSYRKRFGNSSYESMTSHKYIPYDTIYIKFNDEFNKKINICFLCLPYIKKIIFGKKFNQEIGDTNYLVDKMYPWKSYKIAILYNGDFEIIEIIKYFPNTITHIQFGEDFNQFVDDYLPENTNVIYPNHDKIKNVEIINTNFIFPKKY